MVACEFSKQTVMDNTSCSKRQVASLNCPFVPEELSLVFCMRCIAAMYACHTLCHDLVCMSETRYSTMCIIYSQLWHVYIIMHACCMHASGMMPVKSHDFASLASPLVQVCTPCGFVVPCFKSLTYAGARAGGQCTHLGSPHWQGLAAPQIKRTVKRLRPATARHLAAFRIRGDVEDPYDSDVGSEKDLDLASSEVSEGSEDLL